MAEILKAVRDRMLGVTAVSSLVAARVYWQQLPQAVTFPAVVLREISNEEVAHLRGTSGVSVTRVQIDCYSPDYTAAFALREAIRQRVRPWRGTQGSVFVHSVVQGSRNSFYLEPRDGTETGRHVCTIDFLIHHSETALSI